MKQEMKYRGMWPIAPSCKRGCQGKMNGGGWQMNNGVSHCSDQNCWNPLHSIMATCLRSGERRS